MTKFGKKGFNLKRVIGSVLVYVGLILFALWVLVPFSLVLLPPLRGL